MNEEKKEDDESSLGTKEASWSSDIEQVCQDLLFNIKQMQTTHKNNFLTLQKYLMYFRLPIIIISSTNSVFSVGLTIFISQQTTSVINCLLSLAAACISAIELFLGIQKQMDNELTSYHQLKLLSIRISHQLKLEPSNRETNGTIFLNSIMAEYTQFIENSLVNSHEIEDRLEKQTLNKLDSPKRMIMSISTNSLSKEIL
jgi:hypothetical protein